MPDRGQKGSALLILLLLSFGMVVTTALLVSQGIAELKDQTQKRLIIRARYEALGHLAAARHQIEADPTILESYADTGDPIPETEVYIHLVPTTDDTYEMEVSRPVPVDEQTPPLTLQQVAVVSVGGGDWLAQYAILSGEGLVEFFQQLYKPNSGIGGDLWANLMFFGRVDDNDGHVSDFGLNGWIIEDNIWDYSDIFHDDWAKPPYWNPNRAEVFTGEQNILPTRTPIDPINFGDIASVTDLKGDADHAYTKDIAVEFNGDQVTVTPEGSIPETYNIDDVDIIYTDGAVTSIEGTLDGTVTVASEDGVTVTGSVIYVDGGGDPAMSGGDGSGPYVPNPSYDGDSTLGVFTEGNIILDYGVPTNTELNGLFFTRNGNITIEGYVFDQLAPPLNESWPDPNLPVEYTGNFGVKDSLRIFGSLQYENFFLPYSFDIVDFVIGLLPWPPPPQPHRYKDRKFIYDPRLKDNPPPGYGGPGEPGAVFLGTFPTKPD